MSGFWLYLYVAFVFAAADIWFDFSIMRINWIEGKLENSMCERKLSQYLITVFICCRLDDNNHHDEWMVDCQLIIIITWPFFYSIFPDAKFIHFTGDVCRNRCSNFEFSIKLELRKFLAKTIQWTHSYSAEWNISNILSLIDKIKHFFAKIKPDDP